MLSLILCAIVRMLQGKKWHVQLLQHTDMKIEVTCMTLF